MICAKCEKGHKLDAAGRHPDGEECLAVREFLNGTQGRLLLVTENLANARAMAAQARHLMLATLLPVSYFWIVIEVDREKRTKANTPEEWAYLAIRKEVVSLKNIKAMQYFAEHYIWGDETPTILELYLMEQLTFLDYINSHIDADNMLYHFTTDNCFHHNLPDFPDVVYFEVSRGGIVKRRKHKFGECPKRGNHGAKILGEGDGV